MSAQDRHVAAPALPRVSPSRLEAWDRCPAAYRFEYVLRLPQPVGDQQPRRLGSVAHAFPPGLSGSVSWQPPSRSSAP